MAAVARIPVAEMVALKRLSLLFAALAGVVLLGGEAPRGCLGGGAPVVPGPVWMGLAGQDEIIRAEPTRELFHDFGSEQKQIVVFPDAKHILEFSPARDVFFRELENWLREDGG